MRTQVPDGDLGVLIEIAVGEKLARLETRRFGAKSRPRRRPTDEARSQGDPPSSRHIPASVRRAVRERDRDRCTYLDAEGRRCVERDRLEYHHRRPFGLGGGHEPENVCLMCRAHNVYQAERDYGQSAMMRFRRGANVEVS
jgi:5-methylcytosine-specific restriction endonuclease McrA